MSKTHTLQSRKRYKTDPNGIEINVAAITTGTHCLGPGVRSVVWVQGCPFSCHGCIAPDWIPFRENRLVSPERLVGELLADDSISGMTFSGGEPLMQAPALARLAKLARQKREINIICFTGFRIEELERKPGLPGLPELLAEIDVLITGRYISLLNDGIGLKGSRNQQIIHLTNRLKPFDFDKTPRSAEIQIQNGNLLFVGVPPLGIEAALEKVLHTLSRKEIVRSNERI